jgi:hypothetical protein
MLMKTRNTSSNLQNLETEEQLFAYISNYHSEKGRERGLNILKAYCRSRNYLTESAAIRSAFNSENYRITEERAKKSFERLKNKKETELEHEETIKYVNRIYQKLEKTGKGQFGDYHIQMKYFTRNVFGFTKGKKYYENVGRMFSQQQLLYSELTRDVKDNISRTEKIEKTLKELPEFITGQIRELFNNFFSQPQKNDDTNQKYISQKLREILGETKKISSRIGTHKEIGEIDMSVPYQFSRHVKEPEEERHTNPVREIHETTKKEAVIFDGRWDSQGFTETIIFHNVANPNETHEFEAGYPNFCKAFEIDGRYVVKKYGNDVINTFPTNFFRYTIQSKKR